MGTSCTMPTRSASQLQYDLDRVIREVSVGGHADILESKKVGGHVWYLYKGNSDGRIRLAVRQITKHKDAEGRSICFKDMDINCGPYIYTAPAGMVAKAEVWDSFANDWKDRYDAAKAPQKEISPGMKVNLGEVSYTTSYSLSPKSWVVTRDSDSKVFRLTNAQIRSRI